MNAVHRRSESMRGGSSRGGCGGGFRTFDHYRRWLRSLTRHHLPCTPRRRPEHCADQSRPRRPRPGATGSSRRLHCASRGLPPDPRRMVLKGRGDRQNGEALGAVDGGRRVLMWPETDRRVTVEDPAGDITCELRSHRALLSWLVAASLPCTQDHRGIASAASEGDCSTQETPASGVVGDGNRRHAQVEKAAVRSEERGDVTSRRASDRQASSRRAPDPNGLQPHRCPMPS